MGAVFNETFSSMNLAVGLRTGQRSERHIASPAPQARSPWGPMENGEVKPLRSIATLDERHALVLERAGITDTRLLWSEDAQHIASLTGVTRETADRWSCICELLAIRGLADSHAATLVAAGVTSIEGLCSEFATLLLSRIQRHPALQDGPSLRQEVLLGEVQEWIDAANRHKGWTVTKSLSSAPMEV